MGELAALLGGWFGEFLLSQVLPLFSCTCAVSLRLHGSSLNGQIPLVSVSLGLALSGVLSSLTYLPTRPRKCKVPPLRQELQSGKRECAAHGKGGLLSVCRGLKESPESVLGRKWGSDKRFRGVFG